MTELRDTIAKNICDLRTGAGMTQLALAEVLNYSDKAVSKWERAESVPDIAVLKQIAEYFDVSVDYLLEEDHEAHRRHAQRISTATHHNRAIIASLSVACVWCIAVLIFVLLKMATPLEPLAKGGWLFFVYAVPVSMVVLLVFNSIWFNRRRNFLYISFLVWSLIPSLYLSFLCLPPYFNLWPIFFLIVPAQLVICLWSSLRTHI